MVHARFVLIALIAASPLLAAAQSINAGQCIVAGRLNDASRWAPRFDTVQLLGAKDHVIKDTKREILNDARRVRVTQPALLTKCDDDREIARGEEAPIPKEPVPALAPGDYEVEGVGFSKLRRGGELVEVKVRVPVERVVMVKR